MNKLQFSLILISTCCAGFSVSAGNPDASPPKALGATLKDEYAHFSYFSDVEDRGPGDIWLNNSVCNKDGNGLVFKWEKARLIRGVGNDLPQDQCQEDPHPINSYEKQPDTDAPILYTQSKHRRTAAIYREAESQVEQPPPPHTLRSLIRTAYVDAKRTLQKIEVRISSTYLSEKKQISVVIERSPIDLTIGVGSFSRLVTPRTFSEIYSYVKTAHDVPASLLQPGRLLQKRDYEWLPPVMKDDELLTFSPSYKRDSRIVFSIPVEEHMALKLRASTAAVYLLDPEMKLIATGVASLHLPK